MVSAIPGMTRMTHNENFKCSGRGKMVKFECKTCKTSENIHNLRITRETSAFLHPSLLDFVAVYGYTSCRRFPHAWPGPKGDACVLEP